MKRQMAKLAGNLNFGELEMSQGGIRQNEILALAHAASGNMEAYCTMLGAQTKMEARERLAEDMVAAVTAGLKEGFGALASKKKDTT